MNRSVLLGLTAGLVTCAGQLWAQPPQPGYYHPAAPGVARMSDQWTPEGVFAPPAPGLADEHCPSGHCDFLGRPMTGRRGFFTGASAVFLEADFDATTAFFIDDQSGVVQQTSAVPFDFSHQGAPRVWAGWQDNRGLSFRATWFQFSDREQASAVAQDDFVFFRGLPTPTLRGGLIAGGVAGDFIQARSEFEYYTIDAEIAQELLFDLWQLEFGGGFRHVGMAQRYNALATAGGLQVTSDVGRRFDGQGPTLFTEVRIPLFGKKDRRHPGAACLMLFGQARGSIVYGSSKLTALDVNPAFPGPISATARQWERDGVKIGELRLGAQFDVRPVFGKLLFVAAAWESQWLQGIGNLTDLQADQDLVLSGFSLSLGLEW